VAQASDHGAGRLAPKKHDNVNFAGNIRSKDSQTDKVDNIEPGHSGEGSSVCAWVCLGSFQRSIHFSFMLAHPGPDLSSANYIRFPTQTPKT
jgi:hypothetical protein